MICQFFFERYDTGLARPLARRMYWTCMMARLIAFSAVHGPGVEPLRSTARHVFVISYLLGSCLRAHSFTAIPGREYFSVRIGYTNYTSIPGRNGSGHHSLPNERSLNGSCLNGTMLVWDVPPIWQSIVPTYTSTTIAHTSSTLCLVSHHLTCLQTFT
jgi:hypothetical protein